MAKPMTKTDENFFINVEGEGITVLVKDTYRPIYFRDFAGICKKV